MTAAADAALAEARAVSDPLARLFSSAGHRLFLVGGVVRDALVGRFVHGTDIDCTTEARPDAVKRIVAASASALWVQGERFGTIGCVVDGQAFEITTYRAERYRSDSRKPVVTFGDDLIEDLARRDFTVNAMALDAFDGTLVDPHGGRHDLEAGVLRTPLDPEISFSDDPLRMLRAARFVAGHELVPSPGVVDAVRMMGERLRIVAIERVRDEFEKLLLLPDPATGLEFLFQTGLVDHAAPFLSSMDAEILSRTVAAVEAAPDARWASLFVEAPDEADERLRAMRCSTALTQGAVGLLTARQLLAAAPNDPPDIRRLVHACPVEIDSGLEFAIQVATARGEPTGPLERFRVTLTELRRDEVVDGPLLPLAGDEVMALLGLEPGPEVGRALAHLRELIFEKGTLTRGEAVAALYRWSSRDYCAEA